MEILQKMMILIALSRSLGIIGIICNFRSLIKVLSHYSQCVQVGKYITNEWYVNDTFNNPNMNSLRTSLKY